MVVTMSTNAYFSYLIRIWQDDDLHQRNWLASLEDPTTKQLTYFTSLEALFGYLRLIAGEDQEEVSHRHEIST